MYIIDDICYADGCAETIKVQSAKPLPGRMLLVTFVSGEQKLFDTTVLTGSAFDVLDDESIFKSITIFRGVITWNNGEIDIAPEYVYEEGIAYNAPSDQTELVG